MTAEFCLAVTTIDSQSGARTIAAALLDRKLAACVQIFPIESHYTWQGRVQHEAEYVLHIKTRCALFSDLCDAIRDVHTYEVPEIVRIDITAGYKPYLDWIGENATGGPA